MDLLLARRLENDEDFNRKIVTLVKDYVLLGQNSINYWTDEFDTAHDILMCYAPLTRADLENLERGHPKRFVLPMTATQITTMTTFIAQALFGESTPHKVEGRGPEDEVPAEHMNALLKWNAEQQPTYLLGYLWIQDILTFNRGIMYNSWAPLYDVQIGPVTVEDTENIDEATGKPKVYVRHQKTKKPVGGYCRIDLVSPYDFFCDPMLPLWRLPEMRFCGHRTTVAWQELKRRSELSPDHPSYVLPSAVELLRKKDKKKHSIIANVAQQGGSMRSKSMSRSAFERARSASPTGQQNADQNDPGIVEIHEVWIRLVPEDNELYEGSEPVIFQALLGNNEVVLAINESTFKHDAFPYTVAEGRPGGYYQFSPSWTIILKSLQDYVDYLKNRHQEAISRTLGNIFIARADKVNLADFLNPEKEGLIIPVLPEAAGEKLDDIIKQVPINDVTKDFTKELQQWVSFAENVSGANSAMQGQVPEGEVTATAFAGTQQMNAGRMSSIARLISVMGLVPQTKQLVANFQQFLTESMAVRFTPQAETSPAFRGTSSLQISRDVIQGNFDFIAHDGTLPGTDNRKVAAMARTLEAAAQFPQFFEAQPGNIDARAILLSIVKAAGVNIENFIFTPQSLGMAQPGQMQNPPTPQLSLPELGSLPAGAQLPGPSNDGPGRPKIPDILNVPSAMPPQIRPQNAP